jgi:hypothetical protein
MTERNVSIFSATMAAEVSLFVGTEEARYYLNGFCLQSHPNGGAYLVATCGSRMGVFHDTGATIAQSGAIVRLSGDFLKHARKAPKYGAPLAVYLDHGADTAYLAPALGEGESIPAVLTSLPGLQSMCANATIKDATFPDWQRVCPAGVDLTTGKTAATAFDPAMMPVFAKLNTRGAMLITGADAGSPHYVQLSNREDFVGILMPKRGVFPGLPAWFPGNATTTKAAAE